MSAETPWATGLRRLAAPAAIVAVALVLRTWALGRDELWSDEVHTFEALALPPGDLVAERLAAGHQPLYFLALRLWAGLVGHGEAALRLPSAVLGVAVLWPAYRLFRDLADRPSALWGSLLLALHPGLVELSREARMYPLLLLAIVGAAAGIAASLRTGRVGAGFYVAMVAGPLIHASWGLALVGLTGWVLWESARDDGGPAPGVRRGLARGLVLSGLILLAAVFLAGRASGELDRRPWAEEVVVYALRQVSGAGIVREHAAVHGAAFLAWMGAVTLGWWSSGGRTRRFAVSLFVGVHGAAAVAALAFGVAWGPLRYVQAALLPPLLLVGVALAAARVRGWLLAGTLAAGLLGLALLLLGLRFGTVRTHWSREAAHVLARAAASERPAAVRLEALRATPDAGARVVLRHYLAHPRGAAVTPR